MRKAEGQKQYSLYHAIDNYFKVMENEGGSRRLSESKCRAHHKKKGARLMLVNAVAVSDGMQATSWSVSCDINTLLFFLKYSW